MEDSITLSDILQSIQAGEFDVSLFRITLLSLLERGRGRTIVEGLLQEESAISSQTSDRIDNGLINYRNTLQYLVLSFANASENRDFYDEDKKTVLHHATIWGSLESVRSLLKNGADPNSKDVNGRTPLVSAVADRHEEIVNLLIESGADISTSDYEDGTLLNVAIASGWIEFVKFLLDSGVSPERCRTETDFGVSPLKVAVEHGLKDVIALLIDSGMDVKGPLSDVQTILCIAARESSLEVLQFLVEKIDLKCFHDFWVLSYGILSGRIEIVDYLVKLLNTINGDDDTTLNCVATIYPYDVKLIMRCVERGDYLDFVYFKKVLRKQKGILQSTSFCTQAIINHFNNKDLPNLYKIPTVAEKLPSIETLTLKSSDIIQSIEQGVHYEIRKNEYCNLVRPNVIVLQMMAVRSYVDYYDSIATKPEKPPVFDPSCHLCNTSTPVFKLISEAY